MGKKWEGKEWGGRWWLSPLEKDHQMFTHLHLCLLHHDWRRLKDVLSTVLMGHLLPDQYYSILNLRLMTCWDIQLNYMAGECWSLSSVMI
jgi:hypothetical protein